MAAPTDDIEHVQRSISKLKKKARSELKRPEDWQRYGYSTRPELWDGRDVVDSEHVDRVDYQTVDEAEFIERYESLNKPCILVNAMNTWPAMKKWTMKKLRKKFGRQRFKCGEDDDGYPVKMRLEYYDIYQQTNTDDSPMYVFDGTFGEKDGKKEFLSDYELPKYFRDDLFQYVGEERRPPYRWVVIGPQRSGTGIHIDPLGTAAWNALVSGHKRWCLFHPSTPKEALKVPRNLGDSEAASWFAHMIPTVRSPDWPHPKPIEFIQRPGEIVYVPGGWHHVVINVNDTVAVTQNFCSITNFPVVWRRTVRGRPKMSKKWLAALREVKPELAQLASSMDLEADDGLPLSSSSDSSSSSSSSEDEVKAMPETKKKKLTKTKSKSKSKKAKLCQCEECLKKCSICASYIKKGLNPPIH
eukprot:m.112977 g.112977  ORF g.112977 m.112977 type:complete len:414 (-) comp15431_c0_seq1:3086-4327(-)